MFAEVIKKLSPKAKPIYLDGFAANEGLIRNEYKINTPLRETNFLTQVMTETGGCTVVQESGSYKAARIMEIFGVGRHSAAITAAEAARLAGDGPALFERTYGLGNPRKAAELGNTQKGDGWKFRGIGPMQSTGRGAARRWGQRCGADFETDVMVMVSPKFIMLPPLLEWSAGNLNIAADRDDERAIRKRINGGYNGFADAEVWHDKLWALLRTDATQQAWQVAEPMNLTKTIQEQLNALGYAPKLKVDGRYGPATKEAVKWFQKIAGLKVDGAAGPLTQAAMAMRLDSRHVAEIEPDTLAA